MPSSGPETGHCSHPGVPGAKPESKLAGKFFRKI